MTSDHYHGGRGGCVPALQFPAFAAAASRSGSITPLMSEFASVAGAEVIARDD